MRRGPDRQHTRTPGLPARCELARTGAAAGGLDELRKLARTLALGVVTHLPDADLGLRQRCHKTVAVGKRDEPVAVSPQRQYGPGVLKPAPVKRAAPMTRTTP